MRSNQQQKGTAIFMALLMVAIVAGITALLMRGQQLEIRRTEMMMLSEQSYLYSQGIMGWAKSAILQNFIAPQPNTVWPLLLPPVPIADGQGKISGVLQDGQALINVNNLVTITPPMSSTSNTSATAVQNKNSQETAAVQQINPAMMQPASSAGGAGGNGQSILINLFKIIGVPEGQQQNIIKAMQAWMTAPTPSTPNFIDPFNPQYASQNPPYRSAQSPMASVSELRTVSGMTAQIYNKLLPYIIAIPANTTIDTQFASPVVLQAMGVTQQNAQQNNQTNKVAALSSKFFLLRGDVLLSDQHLVLYSLLQRGTDPNNPNIPAVIILWQSFGTL